MKTVRHSMVVRSGLMLVLMMALPQAGIGATDPAPGNFQRGAKIWSANCGRCHNIRGPRELRDDQWITTVFHMRLRAGLTGQESRDVLVFLQGSNTQNAPVVAGMSKSDRKVAASGRDIFFQTCIACHGPDGKGTLPGVPDFTSSTGPLSKSDDLLLKHIEEGFQSPGSPMAMPPKGGNPDLDSDDIKAALGYIRKTFGN